MCRAEPANRVTSMTALARAARPLAFMGSNLKGYGFEWTIETASRYRRYGHRSKTRRAGLPRNANSVSPGPAFAVPVWVNVNSLSARC